jgi:hypothetical protein
MRDVIAWERTSTNYSTTSGRFYRRFNALDLPDKYYSLPDFLF